MPAFDVVAYSGLLPKERELRRRVEGLLEGRQPPDAVIALTDVYTGTRQFTDAADAKRKMRQWVGPNPRFHPHAAQFEFGAWLLPYWDTITQMAKRQKKPPRENPELVNHSKPPSHHIKELFHAGGRPQHYNKVRDAKIILRDNDLSVAINRCREFKAFVNTILRLCGGDAIA